MKCYNTGVSFLLYIPMQLTLISDRFLSVLFRVSICRLEVEDPASDSSVSVINSSDSDESCCLPAIYIGSEGYKSRVSTGHANIAYST